MPAANRQTVDLSGFPDLVVIYLMRGGMEAIYDDVDRPLGLMRVALLQPALGRGHASRTRAGLGGDTADVSPG